MRCHAFLLPIQAGPAFDQKESIFEMILVVCLAAGSAPVFDACGRAGGHLPPAMSGKASFGGVYIDTAHAKLGDDGSKVRYTVTMI